MEENPSESITLNPVNLEKEAMKTNPGQGLVSNVNRKDIWPEIVPMRMLITTRLQ